MDEEIVGTLRIWLISKELKKLPHKARKLFAPNFEFKCPLPVEFSIPCVDGSPPVIYKRRFAVINGGKDPKITAVYYFEK